MYLGIQMTQTEICRLAHELEISFNPYCGYQDPYGCGIGGFKRIEFMNNHRVRYEFLPTTLFDKYDTHLVFTGVTRNSKKVLKNITQNLEKIKPLLQTVDDAHEAILDNRDNHFLHNMNISWTQKKNTSSLITENPKVKDIDDELSQDGNILAHKLCGAGNGGFFLTFSNKGTLTLPYDSVRIKVVSEGVLGESV